MDEAATIAEWKEKNVLIDRKGDDALVMRRMANGNREFVVAHGYDDVTGHWSHGTYYDSIASAVAALEGSTALSEDGETICDIRWMRDDIVQAVEWACGVSLDRNGPDSEEVEAIIDRIIDEIGNGLQDRSTEYGYELIDALMPDDAIERAQTAAERANARSEVRDNAHVRDWYMKAFPDDVLGSRITPDLTFDAALAAVPRGSDFYDALGVGDSVVRERVFEEIAGRNGLSYDDVYSSWLDGKPVQDCSGGVSLKGEAEVSRQASEQLAERGSAGDHVVDKDGR